MNFGHLSQVHNLELVPRFHALENREIEKKSAGIDFVSTCACIAQLCYEAFREVGTLFFQGPPRGVRNRQFGCVKRLAKTGLRYAALKQEIALEAIARRRRLRLR